MIDILDLRVNSKFSTAPAKKLIAGNGGYALVEIDCIVHWEAEDFDGSFSGNKIISNDSTNFITQGFKIGDTIHVETLDSVNTNDGDYQIVNITSNTIFVTSIDSGSGSTTTPVTFTTQIGVQISVYGTTPVTTIDYFFGLVENSSGSSYNSLMDGEIQRFKADEVTATTSASLLPFTTNQSWLTGSPTDRSLNLVTGTGIGTSGASTGYEQCFTISHAVHIFPAILESWIDSGDLSLALASWYAGGNSLKYTPRITAGFESLSVDHTTDGGNVSSFIQPGEVGFYGEYRNGGPAKYTAHSISFEVDGIAADKISTLGTTTVSLQVKKLAGSYTGTEKIDLYVLELPDDTADYCNNPNTAWENLNISNVIMTTASSGMSNENISAAGTSVVGDTMFVQFDYVAEDPTRRYFIYADVGDTTDIEPKSDHHTIEFALDYFEFFIDKSTVLVSGPVYVNDHTSNETTLAYSEYKGWIEDGLLATKQFSVRKTTGDADQYDVALTGVSVNIRCENNDDSTLYFDLETVVYSIPDATTRGFLLPTADPKNYKVLTQLTGTTDYNIYQLQHATKLRFESNIPLPAAHPDFPSPTQKWSYYDSNPDWSIYMNVVITMSITGTDVDETYVDTHKVRIRIKDYDEYDQCEKTCVITHYDNDTGTIVSPVILRDRDTKVIARFYGKALFPCIYERVGTSRDCEFDQLMSGSGSYSSGNGDLSECPDYYGILELLPYNGNEFAIDQISTLYDKRSGSSWIGTLDPDRAKLTAYPYATPEPYIEVEAVIDYTALNTTLPSYTTSARLGKVAVFCHKSIFEEDLPSTTTYTNSLITSFSENQLLVFNGGKELLVQPKCTKSTDTITFSPAITKNLIICCAKSKITARANNDSYVSSDLIGKTIDDFIIFSQPNGGELTTFGSLSFDSTTGTITGLPLNKDFALSFHECIVYDTVSAASTYTAPELVGKTEADLLVFVSGFEMISYGIILSGDTITFPAPQTGIIKIIYVNQ